MATRTELSIPARLGIYGAILVVVFLLAYTLAGALVPSDIVDRWQDRADHGHTTGAASTGPVLLTQRASTGTAVALEGLHR